jgi:hypothetical protein
MEKLRVVLEQLKKYHFWVLCGLIVVLSFLTWFLATGERAKNYADRKSQIDGTIGLVKAVANKSDHPSQSGIDEIHATTTKLLAQVDSAANRLYREQRVSNPLPVVFPDPNQQQGFEAAFERILAPMEKIEKLPPNTLDELYRSRYRFHIQEHFPKLFELIERRTEEDVKPILTESGRPPPATTRMVGIVDWNDAEKKINSFKDRFSGTTPTTLDIFMTQEELWVYETLLKVIRNTNNVGADKDHYKKPASHKEARVKQILTMNIGKDAVQDWTNCEHALINLSGESTTGGAEQTAQQPPAQTQRATTGTSSGESPLAGRYIDDKGKPLADPADGPFPEFRMMPINLKVVIEQKDIPRLLAECANSAMRIDVRGVRILVQNPGPVNVGDVPESATPPPAANNPLPTMQPAGKKRRSEAGANNPMAGHMSPRPMGGDTSTPESGGDDSADPIKPPVPVEVQGIIYIYNPPRVENANESGTNKGALPNGTTPAATVPAASVSATGTRNGATPATPKPASTATPTVPGTTPGTNLTPSPVPPAVPAVPTIPPAKTTATGGHP